MGTSGMRMHMKVAVMVLDRFISKMRSYQIKGAMPDARLRRNGVCELSDLLRFPPQKDRLKTVVVIQMNMHGRDNKVMGVMLKLRQSIGQPSFVMIENVRQGCHAMQRLLLGQSITPDFFPDHISDGL